MRYLSEKYLKRTTIFYNFNVDIKYKFIENFFFKLVTVLKCNFNNCILLNIMNDNCKKFVKNIFIQYNKSFNNYRF